MCFAWHRHGGQPREGEASFVDSESRGARSRWQQCCRFPVAGEHTHTHTHIQHTHTYTHTHTLGLQVLGCEVDAINSVQFSNHTGSARSKTSLGKNLEKRVEKGTFSAGYREYRGQVLDSEMLESLITGLRSNRLLGYTHILTGTTPDHTNHSSRSGLEEIFFNF